MPVCLPSVKNILTILAKIVLAPLGLPGAASSTDEAIQKKVYRLGTTTLAF